jgi:hypothetical protein
MSGTITFVGQGRFHVCFHYKDKINGEYHRGGEVEVSAFDNDGLPLFVGEQGLVGARAYAASNDYNGYTSSFGILEVESGGVIAGGWPLAGVV